MDANEFWKVYFLIETLKIGIDYTIHPPPPQKKRKKWPKGKQGDLDDAREITAV